MNSSPSMIIFAHLFLISVIQKSCHKDIKYHMTLKVIFRDTSHTSQEPWPWTLWETMSPYLQQVVFEKESKWPWNISIWCPVGSHVCRLDIHLAATYSLGPSSIVWSSKLGPPAPPCPPMRVLEVQWSRALSLVCEVAISVAYTHTSDPEDFWA